MCLKRIVKQTVANVSFRAIRISTEMKKNIIRCVKLVERALQSMEIIYFLENNSFFRVIVIISQYSEDFSKIIWAISNTLPPAL